MKVTKFYDMDENQPYQVKIKVRPQQSVQFPNLCVHCAQTATTDMIIRKRIERVTRLIEVPLCHDCERVLQRRSAQEERLMQIRWLVSGVVWSILVAMTLLFTPSALVFTARLLVALLVATLISWLVWGAFQRAQSRAMLPEKQAILRSVALLTFSWRATTFGFTNKLFAERFRALNEAHLMEI